MRPGAQADRHDGPGLVDEPVPGVAAQRLMELESEALCGAGHGERSAERRNQDTPKA
jgi:hypothetical protein